MQKRRWEVNKYDILFFFAVILFFFSENTMNVSVIDGIFNVLEALKFKYIYVFLCCGIFWTVIWKREKLFISEFIIYLENIFVLTLISLISIVIWGNHADLINELLYFLVPLIFSFCLINVKKGEVASCINCVFWILLFGFLLKFRGALSISSILSINFVNSYSPFEGELAFLSILLVIYYSWKGDRKKHIVSLLICVLSFKRLTMILALIISFFMKKLKEKVEITTRQKIVLAVIFILMPILMGLICSDDFANTFYSLTGMDLNSFVKGRFDAINLTFDEYQSGGGLGSVRVFLSDYYRNYYHTNVRSYDLHCDVVRIYFECTVVGLISLVGSYIKSARTSISLMLIGYIFLECCVNHMFGAGRSLYWIVVYMMIYEFNNIQQESFLQM